MVVTTLLKKIVFGLSCLAIVVLIGGALVPPPKASADVASSPGRLLDDGILLNASTMNIAQIQSFLNGKGGYIAKYTALFDCSVNTPDGQTFLGQASHDAYVSIGAPCGQTVSAATIIYYASQVYGVNPQVVLATLQKEQGLVTQASYVQYSFNYAMGYNCPDSGGCSVTANSNFMYQLDGGAWALRFRYERLNGNTSYWPSSTSKACTASTAYYSPSLYPKQTVSFKDDNGINYGSAYIATAATSSLYCYTPHMTNNFSGCVTAYGFSYQSSWPTIGGVSNSQCYAGSYNFYAAFTAWFGNPTYPPSPVYIPDGTYNITGLGSGKNLDVSGGSSTNGASIQLYGDNGTSAQDWVISRDSHGYYSIKNASSGKYLDVDSASTVPGARIQIWDGNGTCAQTWAIQSVGSSYAFLSACSGLAMGANGTTDSTPIHTYANNSSSGQLWTIRSLNQAPITSGFYSISTSGGTALDIPGGSTTSGTPLQIYSSNGTPAQIWQLILQNNGLYELRNPQSGKYLDVVGGRVSAGTSIDIYSGNHTCAQQWAISTNSDGSYGLTSSCSALKLDVSGGAVSTSGTPVDVWDNNGTAAQAWTISKLTTIPNGTYSLLTTSSTALDIPGGSTRSGTRLQVYGRNGTGAQQWKITQQGNGTYELQNPQSGKFLDVVAASTSAGASVDIYDGNHTCAQQWNISANSDGSYGLTSSCSKLKLDVSGGLSATNGTQVDIWGDNATNAQKWMIGPEN